MTNDEKMPNDKMTNGPKKYDLEERTAKFGEEIIKFAKKISMTTVNRSLIDQLVRSGTSVGANYCEADDAHSKKDFLLKIGICKKESRETKHWLRMVETAAPNLTEEIKPLKQEAQELNLIFAAIIRKGRGKI